ncbi:MAG: hypothetical protein ABSG77_04240 [Candidatus Acidiferrum sp.]|jgi:hypothetical protein
MSGQIFRGLVFLFALGTLLYFIREAWRAIIAPEFKRDVAWLRENRLRRRRASRGGK